MGGGEAAAGVGDGRGRRGPEACHRTHHPEEDAEEGADRGGGLRKERERVRQVLPADGKPGGVRDGKAFGRLPREEVREHHDVQLRGGAVAEEGERGGDGGA